MHKTTQTTLRTTPLAATAAALALCATGVHAQSSVQIYGVADAGVTQVSGLKDGTVTQVVSGIMEGSRVGVRVNEDLGGGWRALVTLEHRLEVDTGLVNNRPISGSQLPDRVSQATALGLPAALQPVVNAVSGGIGNTVGVNLGGGFWDRQAFIGLVTPVGAILAGRQYTPAYELSANFDIMGTQSSLAAGQVGSLPAAFDIRQSNALAYRIVLGGLTASLMHAVDEGSTTTGTFNGIMAMYKTPRFALGIGYNTRENELGQTSLTNAILGASLTLGNGQLSTFFATVEDDNPTGVSGIAALVAPQVGAATAAAVQRAYVNGFRQDARIAHLGYKHTFGLHTLYTAITQFDDQRTSDADTRSYGLAYTYALSKRSDINAVVTRFDNNRQGQAAPGGAGYLGGVSASAGTDSTSIALGLRHRF